MTIIEALVAIARSDRPAALAAVDTAVRQTPHALLPAALLRYLRAEADGDVYGSPDALTRFIDGGANRAVYAALHAALQARYVALEPVSLLDLGCGEGRVALAAAQCSVRSVDLVEPSGPLLDVALASFATDRPRVSVRGHAQTADAFLAGLPDAARWDAVQSTFALHTMTAASRAAVLRAVARRSGRLLIAEFDVPDVEDRSRAHAAYAAERYERGLAEHVGDEVVAQGFLMPVLVGQFDPGTARHTHEQSVSAWAAELRAAGFDAVTASTLHPYWWADAVLIEATVAAG